MKAKQTPPSPTSIDPATAYAQQVVSGRIVAGPHVRNAAKRHLKDLARDDLVWDVVEVERIIGFFRTVLRLNGGQFEGLPFHLHPSQAFIVGSIFGWRRKETGRRRFRRAYIEQGKGNGKSPLAAGIGLAGMVSDHENRAEIYAAARSKDQAMVLFRDAVAMVEQSPALAKQVHPSGGNPVWNLRYKNSWFRPISSEDGKSGPRPHMALIDELHEHTNRSMVEMLERGFKWRENPLLFMITNSGSDRNTVCFEEHQNAIDAATGERDTDIQYDQTFSYVCALDEGDDPFEDPDCWIKANPLLGITQRAEELHAAVSQAKAIPGRANNILRLHFCIWTDAEKAWIETGAWIACEDPDFDIEDFAGAECHAGLDLAATRDIVGLALVWPDGFDAEGRPKYAAWAHGFMPEDGLAEKARLDKAPYDLWAEPENGFITATPGKVTRLDYVAHRIVQAADEYDLKSVAYDNWLYSKFNDVLDDMGATLPVQEHPQGWNKRRDSKLSMPESINALEQLILEGRLRVFVSPALRTAITGARFDPSPTGLRKFSKQKATTRIDLAVALAMAIGSATAAATAPPEYQVMFVG